MKSSITPTKKTQDTSVTHPLQTKEWGQFREKMGVAVYHDDSFLLTFHKLPLLPFTVGYFPKGSVFNQEMVEKLRTIGKKHHAIYIQVEPNIRNADLTTLPHGVKPSHHPLFTPYTFILDLTLPEDTLLANFHSKTRYNIKVAQKHNVNVEENNSSQAFAEYLRLTQETTTRQGFYAHSLNYTQTMWDTLAPKGLAKLFTASYNGEVLAAWIIFCFGDTIYYPYGASSRSHREVMAPTLLLWEIVKWGKLHGYTSFDLWGAMGPNPDIHDPWYGFHRFKEGFSPELVEFVGSFDIVINPILYPLYCLADVIRWRILKKLR